LYKNIKFCDTLYLWVFEASLFPTTMFADDINLHMSASSIKTVQNKDNFKTLTGLAQTNCLLTTTKLITVY